MFEKTKLIKTIKLVNPTNQKAPGLFGMTVDPGVIFFGDLVYSLDTGSYHFIGTSGLKFDYNFEAGTEEQAEQIANEYIIKNSAEIIKYLFEEQKNELNETYTLAAKH